MSDEFVEKRKGLKIIITILIILVILAGIGIGGYFVLKKTLLNPESYITVTKKLFKESIEKHFDNLIETEKDSNIKGTISFKTDTKEFNYLNSLLIDYDIISSFKNEEIQSNIKLKENSKEILDTNFYFIKDSLYLDSHDLYSKTLLVDKLDVNIFDEINKVNKEKKDYTEVISNYFDYIFNSLKEAKMNSSMVNLYKVKYTYIIDDTNREKIQNKYDNYIQNDKTIQLLIKNGNIDKNMFNITFNNMEIDIVKSVGMGKIYNIEIKSDKDQIFLLEIDDKNENLYHVEIGEEKGTLTIDKDTYTYQVFENNVLINTFKLTLNDKLVRFSFTSEDNEIVISLKEESKYSSSITFSIKEKNGSNIELSETIHKVNDTTQISAYLDIYDGNEKITVKIDCTIDSKDNLLTKKDVSNYVDINNLSEKEQQIISENIMKKLQNSKLFENIMKEDNI